MAAISSFVGRSLRLANKVCVVTGAGGGIGRASAIIFAREGAKVMCADLNHEAAQETVQHINDAVGEEVAIAAEVDVALASDVESLMESTEGNFGRIDVVFNNAGLMHGADDDAINTEEEIWDLTMDVNVKGVWLVDGIV